MIKQALCLTLAVQTQGLLIVIPRAAPAVSCAGIMVISGFSSVEVNGVYQAVDSENPLVFNGEWFTLKFEGNNLIITAEPLPESVQSRSFKLDVTAGDIFDHFVFSQQRNT